MEILQLLITGITEGCVYGLIALGFVLIYKATELVNFAQGDLMMLGAFSAISFVELGFPYWIAILSALVCMAVFGYLLDKLVLRSMIGQPAFAVIILTIGLGFVFRAIAGEIWGHEPRTLVTPFSGTVIDFFGFSLSQESLVLVIVTAVLCLLLYLFFTFTPLGIVMQAASQNQLAAYYMGIPVKQIFSLIWALSAAIATVAGILMAPISLVDPQMGFLGIKAFAAAVIGGFGSLPGAILGGIIIGGSEQIAGAYFPDGWKQIAPYLIMIIVLTLRPQGLLVKTQKKKV